MAIGKVELMHASVYQNTSSGEQQYIWNKIKKKTKEVRREAWVWKEANRAQKKKKSQRPKLSLSNYTNNKHNLFVFYKRLKIYNEIQLIKNKMD